MSEKQIDRFSLLTNVDDITETQRSLESLIWEAWKTALEEDIRANIVMINKGIVKVKKHPFVFMNNVSMMPPLICGLEAHLTDELPSEIAFAVAEAPETERGKLIEQGRREGYIEGKRDGYEEGVRAMAQRLCKYYTTLPLPKTQPAVVEYNIRTLAEELLEEED